MRSCTIKGWWRCVLYAWNCQKNLKVEVIGVKKPNEMAMIHDSDGGKRPRLNRWMVLNWFWESSSIAQCLQQSTPPFIIFFPHSVVGLNGDIATTTTLQEVGRHSIAQY